MDFVLLVNDSCKKLSHPNNYYNHLWDCICKQKDIDSEAYLKEKTVFLNHLPLNQQAFFTDCIHKVEQIQNENASINWQDLDQKYLCVVLYWAISQLETATPLISISASRLYLLLNSLPRDQEQAIYFDTIYSAILTSIEFFLPSDDVNLHLHVLLENMKVFLSNVNLKNDMVKQTASVLYKIVCSERQTFFRVFNIGITAIIYCTNFDAS